MSEKYMTVDISTVDVHVPSPLKQKNETPKETPTIESLTLKINQLEKMLKPKSNSKKIKPKQKTITTTCDTMRKRPPYTMETWNGLGSLVAG